jgi:hypothetical protein
VKSQRVIGRDGPVVFDGKADQMECIGHILAQELHRGRVAERLAEEGEEFDAYVPDTDEYDVDGREREAEEE